MIVTVRRKKPRKSNIASGTSELKWREMRKRRRDEDEDDDHMTKSHKGQICFLGSGPEGDEVL